MWATFSYLDVMLLHDRKTKLSLNPIHIHSIMDFHHDDYFLLTMINYFRVFRNKVRYIPNSEMSCFYITSKLQRFAWFTVGPNEVRAPFQPIWLYDSWKLCWFSKVKLKSIQLSFLLKIRQTAEAPEYLKTPSYDLNPGISQVQRMKEVSTTA